MIKARKASASAITVAVVAVLFFAVQRMYWREPRPTVQIHQGTFGTPINVPGTYEFRNPRLTLSVWTDDQNLVQYELKNESGVVLAHSTERASAFSRWALAVDESRRLWFYSGDVGFYAWDGASDGVSRPLAKDSALVGSVPESMKGYLK